MAGGKLPRYLLIYGTPKEVPWQLQYALGHIAFTGRIDLTGAALENYVTALCNDWDGATAQPSKAVVWATFHGGSDITALMLGSIASKVYEDLREDDDIGPDGALCINGSVADATHDTLQSALGEKHPGLVVTTSHGSTGPLDNAEVLRNDLGKLVDNDGALLNIDELLAAWQPGGAIWYAHACCSAGTSAKSAYEGVLEPGSAIDELLQGLTLAGDVTAPLPKALLGAPQPLRAFVGHVEPTFDWTLRSATTGQILTTSTRQALYRRLYQPLPIGLALDELHRQATQLHALHNAAVAAFGNHDTRGAAGPAPGGERSRVAGHVGRSDGNSAPRSDSVGPTVSALRRSPAHSSPAQDPGGRAALFRQFGHLDEEYRQRTWRFVPHCC